MITRNCYHFNIIIFPCTYFVLSFMLSFLEALSFMISFDAIIFHGQRMLSFLCYHFPLYIFCVIIYVIIYCYHDIYIMKNDNILYTQKGQQLKNDNILYNQKDNIKEFKNDNIYTIKMITSPTLENDNIQAFKNDNIYFMKNDNILYTWKW